MQLVRMSFVVSSGAPKNSEDLGCAANQAGRGDTWTDLAKTSIERCQGLRERDSQLAELRARYQADFEQRVDTYSYVPEKHTALTKAVFRKVGVQLG